LKQKYNSKVKWKDIKTADINLIAINWTVQVVVQMIILIVHMKLLTVTPILTQKVHFRILTHPMKHVQAAKDPVVLVKLKVQVHVKLRARVIHPLVLLVLTVAQICHVHVLHVKTTVYHILIHDPTSTQTVIHVANLIIVNHVAKILVMIVVIVLTKNLTAVQKIVVLSSVRNLISTGLDQI